MDAPSRPPDAPGPILLYFRSHHTDSLVRGDRRLKQMLKPIRDRFHRRQKITGFGMSFLLLKRALERAGYDVRVNDRRHARAHPDWPVGLIGFPALLEEWDLPNPALLGPSLFDHPRLAPGLMDDPRNRRLVVLADWMRAMFARTYGEVCVSWFAGIDLEAWPDARDHRKDIDVLIYDKIRWDRHAVAPRLLAPVRERLAERGLRVAELRYKDHDHDTYRDHLSRARAMVFLCEHETQGLAYQEALAMNVPVLAWDLGYWADPLWKVTDGEPVPASSVPFFSEACGARFRVPDEFGAAFDRFWAQLAAYEPRRYVAEALSMERSARIYADAYFSLLKEDALAQAD